MYDGRRGSRFDGSGDAVRPPEEEEMAPNDAEMPDHGPVKSLLEQLGDQGIAKREDLSLEL